MLALGQLMGLSKAGGGFFWGVDMCELPERERQCSRLGHPLSNLCSISHHMDTDQTLLITPTLNSPQTAA